MSDPTQVTQPTSRLQQAYQRKYDELLAVPREQLLPVNLDINAVYTLGTGVLVKVRPFREQLLALPGINKKYIEDLEDYLLTLGHAQALHLAAITPPASIPELYAKLLAKRELLFADATVHAVRGIISADQLRELRGPIGHSATAFDVLALVTILRGVWDKVQGKTALEAKDLEEAETFSDQLLIAVGERAMSEEQIAIATLNRQRAFTLFVRAYDELVRGMTFLRWHERDVDDFAPSLYSTKVGRRPRKSEDDGDETPAPTTPGTTVPSTQPAAPGNGAPSPHNGAPSAPVGHPDAPPFSQG